MNPTEKKPLVDNFFDYNPNAPKIETTSWNVENVTTSTTKNIVTRSENVTNNYYSNTG